MTTYIVAVATSKIDIPLGSLAPEDFLKRTTTKRNII